MLLACATDSLAHWQTADMLQLKKTMVSNESENNKNVWGINFWFAFSLDLSINTQDFTMMHGV